MRLRDLLLSPPPPAAVRVAAIDGVRSELLAQSRTLGGPMFKRLQPRARGMAFMIRRRFAHVHIAIDAPEIG